MKRKLILLIALLSLTEYSIAQDSYKNNRNLTSTLQETSLFGSAPLLFRLKFGFGAFIHLRDKDSKNPNVPDEFQVIEERISIAALYSDNPGISFDASISVLNDENSENRYFIGLGYQFHFLKSEYSSIDIILGNKLNAHFFFPYIQYEHTVNKQGIIFYGAAGPSFRKYVGRGEYDDYNLKNTYDLSTSLKINSGFSFHKLTKYPIYINLEMSFDIGTINRKGVDFYYNDEKVGHAEADGTMKFRDDMLVFSFSIGYQFARKK